MERAQLVASLTEPPSAGGAEIAALAHRADWLELRADLAGDIASDWLRERFPGKLLYTLRSSAEGGAFDAPRERRRQRIVAAARGFDLVDLEGDRDLASDLLSEIEPERRLLSWHGPAGDRVGLQGRFAHLAGVPAAFYKLVPGAGHAGEELPVLELAAELRRRDVIAFAGGEIGAWTRLVAPRLGAPVVYASTGSTPAAPGQPSLERLRADFGLPELPRVERLYGVVGSPSQHSLSPRLHNAAYRALGIPALFVAFEAPSFGDFWLEVVEGPTLAAIQLPLEGLAVTTPHKELALAVAGASSPLAQRLQAANTLVLTEGVWEAESTDAQGVIGALRARGVDPRGRKALVVGCGGAGRAAAFGLDRAGARVVLANRGLERGLTAARSLGLPFVPLAEVVGARFDLFVHATPLGRRANDEAPLPIEELPPESVVVDLVYGLEPTRWIRSARRRGLVAIDGREVLLCQAEPQFRAMTGRDLPLEIVRQALGLNGAEA